MDHADTWKEYFARWPQNLRRRGVLVTDFEQIPFVNFAPGDTTLLLERQAPDTVGARMVVVPFEEVRALKITEVVDAKTMASFGYFRAPRAPAPAAT